ncbi:MAG: hypothetical protein WC740_15185 [Verrucomicrobiia bacterium]
MIDEILNVRLVMTFAIVLTILANAPTILLAFQYRANPANGWLLFTNSPNRYLFSALFLPIVFLAILTAWGLIHHLTTNFLTKAQAPVFLWFTQPATVVLLAIIIASVFSLWDLSTGNFNNADLRAPYGPAAMKARDKIIASKSVSPDGEFAESPPAAGNAKWKNVHSTEIAARLLKGDCDVAGARAFLRRVEMERDHWLDKNMMHANLVNVWFFSLGLWLTIYLVVLVVYLAKTFPVVSKAPLVTCNYLLLIALCMLALWVCFRAYELREFKECMGAESPESLDLLLGIIVFFVGFFFLYADSDKAGVTSVVPFLLIPMGAMATNYWAYRMAREWYGSAMAVKNFAILAVVWVLFLVLAYVLFMKTRQVS